MINPDTGIPSSNSTNSDSPSRCKNALPELVENIHSCILPNLNWCKNMQYLHCESKISSVVVDSYRTCKCLTEYLSKPRVTGSLIRQINPSCNDVPEPFQAPLNILIFLVNIKYRNAIVRLKDCN